MARKSLLLSNRYFLFGDNVNLYLHILPFCFGCQEAHALTCNPELLRDQDIRIQISMTDFPSGFIIPFYLSFLFISIYCYFIALLPDKPH